MIASSLSGATKTIGPHPQAGLASHHHDMAVGLVGGGGGLAVGNGGVGVNPCYVVEDYVWVDREGRPTSPPSHSYEPGGKKDPVRKVRPTKEGIVRSYALRSST